MRLSSSIGSPLLPAVVAALVVSSTLPLRAEDRFQFDLIGEARLSYYNFTDLKKPYQGVDDFTVLRLTAWLDDDHSLGAFFDLIPVITTEGEFFFQRHVQANAGLHWYPLLDRGAYLRPVRLFVQVSARMYYDEPAGVDLLDDDLQIGFDYYHDNLFLDAQRLARFLFTSLTWRDTNFSFDDYRALVWFGNVKLGRKLDVERGLVIPVAIADWTAVPDYDERFFENFLRLGAGVRWFPSTERGPGLKNDFIRRFNVFAEVLRNVAWLGEAAPPVVEETDYRLGLAFGTGGFFRDRER